MISVYERRSSSMAPALFGVGSAAFLAAIVAGALTGLWFSHTLMIIGTAGGATLMALSLKDVVLFFASPRRLSLDDTRLTYGRKRVELKTLCAVRFNHTKRVLNLRFESGEELSIRPAFWQNGEELYDRIVEVLRAVRGPETERRLSAEGHVPFGSVTVFADRLEVMKRAFPFSDIAGIRMRTTVRTRGGEEKYGEKFEYMVVTLKDGANCKILRDGIVNEPLLFDFLSRRLPE